MKPGIKKIIIVFLMFLHAGLIGQGDPARLQCLEVKDNGDVILYWLPEDVSTGANAYYIYHSSVPTGPFNQLEIITNILIDSYRHVDADALSTPQYYYMLVDRAGGISPPSDTLSSMLLSISTQDFEILNLAWLPLHTPLTPSRHPFYLLFREYPPGDWMIVDSTLDLTISHHFWPCNENSDTVFFKIGVRDSLTECLSFSNRMGEVLKNISNRYPPMIDSVSIDSDGHPVIGWQPGTEPDIHGYTMFRVTASNDSIDYIEGRYNTSYTHQSLNACDVSYSYIILSVDSCGNESPFPYDPITLLDKPHSTIYLADIQYDPCQMTNTLSWNEYRNFDPPLAYSRIFVSDDGVIFQELATIPVGQTSFVHSNLQGNTTYTYYVRAYSGDLQKTSTSCRKQARTYNSPRPEFMYTRYVTIEDNQRVNILFYTDIRANVQSYRILRSTEPGGPFESVGSLPNQGDEFVSFSDVTAEVNSNGYYYQIEVIDSCGQSLVFANMSRTIFLQVEALETMQNVLSWNAYESWDGSVAGYRIYRRSDNSGLNLIQTVDPSMLSYTDDVSGLSGNTSRISYLVEAFEGDNNSFGFQESSRSNEAVAEQEAIIFMPNAILPRGVFPNNQLKPVFVFIGSQGYEFLVYNRWGQLVFRTTDPEMGWDGTYNGNYADAGVYVWLIRYQDSLNQPQVAKGNFVVIY